MQRNPCSTGGGAVGYGARGMARQTSLEKVVFDDDCSASHAFAYPTRRTSLLGASASSANATNYITVTTPAIVSASFRNLPLRFAADTSFRAFKLEPRLRPRCQRAVCATAMSPFLGHILLLCLSLDASIHKYLESNDFKSTLGVAPGCMR
jgi:hypothetical protein